MPHFQLQLTPLCEFSIDDEQLVVYLNSCFFLSLFSASTTLWSLSVLLFSEYLSMHAHDFNIIHTDIYRCNLFIGSNLSRHKHENCICITCLWLYSRYICFHRNWRFLCVIFLSHASQFNYDGVIFGLVK